MALHTRTLQGLCLLVVLLFKGCNSQPSASGITTTPDSTTALPTPTIRGPLYPKGGTTVVQVNDGSSPAIHLERRPFVYFGRRYSQIYVNTNGHLTFNNSLSENRPQKFPAFGTIDLIAPFWTDLDNRVNGEITYDQYTHGSILTQATEDIKQYFPDLGFSAQWVFVATWYEVPYHRYRMSRSLDQTSRTTFQAVLIFGDRYTFVLMNYGKIDSTSLNVQAGYDTINSTYHRTIGSSFPDQTSDYLNLRTGSNVNVTGRWAFQVDGGSSARGCTFDGSPVQFGDSFWSDNTCHQRCTCTSDGLQCHKESCALSQICRRDSFQFSCQRAPTQTCTVWGDPHYVTFDGALAHFQGTCSYIISESVDCTATETGFRVVATNSHRGSNRVSFVSAVDIYLSNQEETAYIRIGANRIVKVNNSAVSLPATAGGLAQVESDGSYVVVNASDVMVQFDGHGTLLVRVGQNRHNRVAGMCGNFNGDPADDKALPNGIVAQNDNDFGDGWKSNTSRSGCGATDDRSGGGVENCREKYSQLCSIITNTTGPFSACHQHSDPQPFFTSCVYDLCLYTPANRIFHTDMLCSAVSSYQATCAVLGLDIPRADLPCAETDPCEELDCVEHEWCGHTTHDVYGCFCDENHHRRKNESYDSFVSCAGSAGNMSLSRCQLFEDGFRPEVLHLKDSSCKGTLQDGMLVFHFDNNAELCETGLTSNGTYFKYENVVQGEVDPHDKSIISRQKSCRLPFTCQYPLNQSVSMDMKISPISSIVNRRLPSGVGSYQMKMIPFEDKDYRNPYTGENNMEVELDSRLYIEVRSKGVDKRQIATVLDSCWATPVNNANDPVRWDLLINECPNEEDTTVEVDKNGVSDVARFSFKMITFTNHSTIFLHCQIHLCVLGTHNKCTADCYPGNHGRRRREVSYDIAGISVGPLTWTIQSEGPVRSVLGSGTHTSLQVSHSTSLHTFSSLLILLVTLLTVATLS